VSNIPERVGSIYVTRIANRSTKPKAKQCQLRKYPMGIKILVVDDEDYQRDLLQKLLSKLGYSVKTAESSEAGLAILADENFDVIISDLIMLDMDGVEFCQRVRETNSKSVIIALTGHSDLYDMQKLKRVGFDNYLTKPIKIEVIQEAIEAGLAKVKQRNKDTKKRR
jgi:CheY-like chemotaxis protein